MSDLQLEIEELGLIYGKDFISKGPRNLEVSVSTRGRSATISYVVPPEYPGEIPKISAEIAGAPNEEYISFLTRQAATMRGLPMLAFLAGEARDFLAGLADRKIEEQQEHVTQTPFSRERFLLWLEKFNLERAVGKTDVGRALTGKEFFLRDMAQHSSSE